MDDSSDEEEGGGFASSEQINISEEERSKCLEAAEDSKASGNKCFSAGDYEGALKHYSLAVSSLKKTGARDAVILANRSATYLALKIYVPAYHDAVLSAEIDANNWKAHWRQGIALLAMVKKKFRTQQAIEAFERCLRCSSLPPSKADEVKTELRRARTRLAQQEDETPMADMSNCAPS